MQVCVIGNPHELIEHSDLGLVQVYLSLGQRWRLEHLQEEAHHLPHVILQALKSCIQSTQSLKTEGCLHDLQRPWRALHILAV